MYREDSTRYKSFSRRALILGGGQLALMGVISGRMYQLQILESDKYKMLAEENRINMRLLPPSRGRILDRIGIPMATNRENFRLLLVAELTQNIGHTLKLLGQIIPISNQELHRILDDIKNRQRFVPVSISENLDWNSVSRIEVNAPDLPGVVIDVAQSREYPFGTKVSHLLGYVAAVSEKDKKKNRKIDPLLELPGFKIGKSGIEKLHDLKLRGKAGTSQLEVNALGRVIRELSRKNGTPGDDLILTIDLNIQKFAIERLKENRAASAVVMDVHTGALLALVSVPGFDPNLFNKGLSQNNWQKIIEDPLAPLTNKAVSGQYAPGSTFKMIVAMAALEYRVISSKNRIFCPGHVQLGNTRLHCWKTRGHGWVNLNSAIQQSCDTYFYEIAKRVGINRIADFGRRFGLGSATGIDLPNEYAGLMPTTQWKTKQFGVSWQKGETLIAGIGQGFVLTTPLQLAVMTSRIASGKEVQPYLLKGIISKGQTSFVQRAAAGPVKVKPNVLRLVVKGMNAVTNTSRGTAYRSRIVEKGLEMAGKTGTSQVKRISQFERETGVIKFKNRPWTDRDHALFVGFAPVKNPCYAVSVVVEHGGSGSKSAAPIARDILQRTLSRDHSQFFDRSD